MVKRRGDAETASRCYHSRLSQPATAMMETNPIRARITDLRERAETLRGYL